MKNNIHRYLRHDSIISRREYDKSFYRKNLEIFLFILKFKVSGSKIFRCFNIYMHKKRYRITLNLIFL